MKSFNKLLFILIIIYFNSCNYRTPSNIRFTKTTGLELSNSIKVVQDRFEESGPDYGLYFEFKLIEEDCLQIIEEINKSKDWTKTDNGWEFHKTNDGIIFYIMFDRVECKIIYREELI